MGVRIAAVTGAVVAAIVVSWASPAAASQSAAYTATFRVVALTHSSSSRKSELPLYEGSSNASWRLAPPTKQAPNVISIQSNGPLTIGGGRVNIRGAFTARARSNRNGNCALTAATGSKEYPAVAPGAFQVTIGSDPKSSNRVLFVQGPGQNVHATLGNPYFPSECSTSLTGEPDLDDFGLKSLPASTFLKKAVVIRFAGTRSDHGIAYRWSTTFTLKRIKLETS